MVFNDQQVHIFVRRDVPLVSSFAIPEQSLGEVVIHTQATLLQLTQFILRYGTSLIGGLAEPECGLGAVLLHPQTALV